jgi:hypothetical protein
VILQIHYLHSNVCTKKEPSQKRRKKHEHKPYSISRTLEAPSSKTRLTVEQAFSSPSSVWLPLRQDLGNPCTGTERLQLLKLDRQGVGFLVTWKGAERCISLTHWSSIQSREFNQSSPSTILLRTRPPPGRPGCRACGSRVFCPRWRRKAESSCISFLAAGGGYHDRRCYSGTGAGRCCTAARVHSDRPPSSLQRNRRRTRRFLESYRRTRRRGLHLECPEVGPPVDGCRERR